MGILLDFGKTRVNEAQGQLEEFMKGPIKYLQTNQPVRKAVLLECLELLRPEKDAQYQQTIANWKRPDRTSSS
jgi:hypothetical protein